jgi:hypothetical protein
MKRALVVTLAAVFASACVLTSAFADASFTDPAGDAADAPDVTGVAVSNDKGGNILFHVTLNNFTPESRLTIYLDTDKNKERIQWTAPHEPRSARRPLDAAARHLTTVLAAGFDSSG